jgi:hypothetical protein
MTVVKCRALELPSNADNLIPHYCCVRLPHQTTLITQIVDFYSKIYTQTQPPRFKRLRHYFVGKPIKPAIVNLLNVVVCHQPDK